MLSKIKNIVFDIGGVLVDLDLPRCLNAFGEIGFEGAKDLVSCYHPQDFFGALERGEITIHEFCSRIREISGGDFTDDEICGAYTSLLVAIPIAKLRLMESLRKRGFRVYALSNMSPVMMKRVRELFEADGHVMEDYFDDMFISCEMGVMKPDPQIYDMLLGKTGAVPSETLFIDDGERNIAAGREKGLMVYLAKERENFAHLFE